MSDTSASRLLQGVAVGVVLSDQNEDAVFRTALRAKRRGHPVFVTSLREDSDTLDALADVGAVVIAPPSEQASQSDLHRLLSRTARERGSTGIILQTRDCPRIDYDRTAAAFERADYEVIAIPEHWEQTPNGPTVVVGIPAYNAVDSIGQVVERAAAYADEVIVDADGQHDPGDIPTLVETQTRHDVDIVIGSRYVGERKTKIPLVRSVGLAVINNLTNASLGKLRPSGFIRDTQSGYRCYSLYATRSLASDRLIGDNMGASTDILHHALRNRLSVSEVETTISYDVENASSQGSVSHGLDLLRNILWTIEYGQPLLILGLPGGVITLLGVTMTVQLIARAVQTGTLVSARLVPPILFAIGGVLMCIAAVMMQVLNRHPSIARLQSDENS